MKKRKLSILGLSYSQTQIGAYVLVLADKKSNKKLPIIIKAAEAQRIALEIEKIKPAGARPLTHDLFKSLADSFSIEIKEVFIYSLVEGIFYSKIIATNEVGEVVEIESTAGDAVAIASIYKCPVYSTTEIIDLVGIVINPDGSIPKEQDIEDVEDIDDIDDENISQKRVVSVEDLQKMMQEAIANEEYEIAAELRDRIEKLKQ
jgi:bifunctional DNase/RNase